MSILKKIFQADEAPAKKTATTPATATQATQSAAHLSSRFLEGVLVRPLTTEKSSLLQADNTYVFQVRRSANKVTVARAVEAAYGVKPIAVAVVSVPAKRRWRRRIEGATPAWKKAIVTLPKGKTISIVEGV